MSGRHAAWTRRLRVERLEERRVLAAFTVTNLLDGPVNAAGQLPGSLRQAVFDANATPGPHEITFPGLSGTITLTEGELLVTESVDFNGPGAELLTISGGGSSRVLNIDDGNSSLNQSVLLAGLTLADGDTTGLGFNAEGGAIRAVESFELAESIITNSFSEDDGGGLYAEVEADGGTISIRDSVITGNRADGQGGGAFVGRTFMGTTTIERSTFSYNTGTLDLIASNGGGGLALIAVGEVQVSDSTFSGNVSTFSGGGGLSIQGLSSAEVTLTGITVSRNFAREGAGVEIDATTSTATPILIRHSTVTGNRLEVSSADRGGGVLAAFSSNVELDHTIVAGNITSRNDPSDLSVDRFSTLTASYSLIGDNANSSLTEAPVGSPDASGNLIGSAAGGGVIDAGLTPLADIGGPTKVHGLNASSPAIDSGDVAVVSPPAFDQRGGPFARIVDGDATPGAVIDIGAFEAQDFTAPATLIVDSELDLMDGDYGAGNLSLREAVALANADANTPQTIRFAASLDGATLKQRFGTLALTDDVELLGLGMNRLTIDGQGIAPVLRFDDGDDATQRAVVVEDLAITGGSGLAQGASNEEAAGITSYEQGRLRRLHVHDNHGLGFVGGLFSNSDGAATELVDSLIELNTSEGSTAGGVLNAQNNGSLRVHGATFRGNSTPFGSGGALIASQLDGSVLVEESSFVDNTSTTGSGGGLLAAAVTDGSLTVRRSRLTGNEAGLGGGAYMFATEGGDIVASELEVTGNEAVTASGGGGLQISPGLDSIVILEESTLSGNTSGGSGGGVNIRSFNGFTILTQVTISDNEAASDGGGVHSLVSGPGLAVIQLSTITNNRANGAQVGGRGGGVFSIAGELELDNTIVAGNTALDASADAGTDPVGFGGSPGVIAAGDSIIGENAGSGLAESQTPDADGNLIGSAAGGGVIDARLGPLAANGGFTLTHLPLAGSPAIDAGGSLGATVPAFDQRGEPFRRTVGSRRDIGAIEAQPNADFDGDSDVDLADLMAQQRGFGVTPAALTDGDADGDESVGLSDQAVWETQFGRGEVAPPNADFDSDGDVDLFDLMRLQRYFGAEVGALPEEGDANADDRIDAADLAIWEAAFGQGAASTGPGFSEGLINALTYGVEARGAGDARESGADAGVDAYFALEAAGAGPMLAAVGDGVLSEQHAEETAAAEEVDRDGQEESDPAAVGDSGLPQVL